MVLTSESVKESTVILQTSREIRNSLRLTFMVEYV